MTDIILRDCGRVGWLPIIERDGKEIYRGEHQDSAHRAMMMAEEWLDEQG